MKFWQRGMKDYISDYYRDSAARASQPKQKASRTQTVRPDSLEMEKAFPIEIWSERIEEGRSTTSDGGYVEHYNNIA
jgi:hypothetical protein